LNQEYKEKLISSIV